MKKTLLFYLIACLTISLQAQNFEKYFLNQTLRLDYLHIGKNDVEKFEIKQFSAGGIWSGTRSSLIDPHRYGDVLFQVYDSASNQLIFARSYSCLFNEYKATERAKTEMGNFEECINMPMPQNTVKYTFTSYSRRNESTLLYEGYYNPQLTITQQFTKEYKTIDLYKGGNPENCIDILFIPDGYSSKDKKELMFDMKRFADYITNCSPYKENLSHINIRAIKGFSEESGITDPNNNIQKNTLLNSSYNVIDVDRYLMCLNVWKMNAIADDAPYDVIIIVANSDKYGGGGIYNFYATVNNEGMFSDYVIVHEMGHLIGGLADEYFTSEVSVMDYYPTDIEPIEPNLTTLVNFDKKWKSMMESTTPIPTPASKKYKGVLGVYEGGGYVSKGVYRPWQDCTMKEGIYNNFCPVCTQTLIEAIEYYSK
ncbi:MAG: M64 family metallopeptidase [Bacteroidales bacterium]|nr:M64 family metallopeptidase [Bacteroidales bacterium]